MWTFEDVNYWNPCLTSSDRTPVSWYSTVALLDSIETSRIETSVNGKHQQRRRKYFKGTTFGMNLVSITIMSLCVKFLCRPVQAGKFKADTSTKLTQRCKCMPSNRINWPASTSSSNELQSPPTSGVRVHCNTDTRLAWERAMNCELIHTVAWFSRSEKMGWVLVAAAVILPVLVKRRPAWWFQTSREIWIWRRYATDFGDRGSRLIGIINLWYHGVNHGYHITE